MWETLRLSLGAFVTSAGFGGLAAVIAALIAARVAADRARDQHEAEREADARERWWLGWRWVWDNRFELGDEEILDALDGLNDLVSTQEQAILLGVTTAALMGR